jgi:hypothetical protein
MPTSRQLGETYGTAHMELWGWVVLAANAALLLLMLFVGEAVREAIKRSARAGIEAIERRDVWQRLGSSVQGRRSRSSRVMMLVAMTCSARACMARSPWRLGTPARSSRLRRYSIRLTSVVRGHPSTRAASA